MAGTTTTYKRAGAYVTDPVLNETTGQFSANYTTGVSERRADVSTYLHSGLKNADARTTDGSAVAADRQYDAFGNLTGGNGTWNGPFGYAGGFGYQEDGDSGLKLLGHRYYDSTTGRFLSKDPIGDGRNWYSYCENNPIRRVDNAGLDWIVIVMDKGGRGQGSHARMGILRKNRYKKVYDIDWYGFYSDGKIHYDDKPAVGGNTESVWIPASDRRQVTRLRKSIMAMRDDEGAPGYDLRTNNCAQVLWLLLIEAGYVSDPGTSGAVGIDGPRGLLQELSNFGGNRPTSPFPGWTPWWESPVRSGKKPKRKGCS